MRPFRNSILKMSDEGKFAIPAFNYSDIWELEAIIEAANELRAIVFAASNMQIVETHGIKQLGALGVINHETSSGHIINHLDHSSSVELCKRAIDAGYQSVMFDGSLLPLDENIAKTREVVEYAHANGVIVEAEIGKILGRGVESNYSGDDFLVQVPDAVELVERTGVDSLAVGIGTAHGFYKEKPKINIQRLKDVNAAVSIPLVLHGGTGIPYEIVMQCIANGIAKVNVGTLLHATYIEKLREDIKYYSSANIPDLMIPVKEAVKEVVKEWISICSAADRY